MTAAPPDARTGITAYTGPENHFDLYVSGSGGERHATLRLRAADLVAEHTVPLAGTRPATLAVSCDGAEYRFTAETAGGSVVTGSGSARLLDTHWAPAFGSEHFGVFTSGPGTGTASLTDVGGDNVG